MRLLNWTSTRIDGDFGQNVTNPTNYQEMSFYYAEDNGGWTRANGKVFPPKYKDCQLVTVGIIITLLL